MLRSFGKLFKGHRTNGSVGILESRKPEEDVDVVEVNLASLCHTQNESKEHTGWQNARSKFYSKRDQSSNQNDFGNRDGANNQDHQSFRSIFSVKDALGLGSVAAVSLKACQLPGERRKTCIQSLGLPPYIKKAAVGLTVTRTAFAQTGSKVAGLPTSSKFYGPASSSGESSRSSSPDVWFRDGSDSEDDIGTGRLRLSSTEATIPSSQVSATQSSRRLEPRDLESIIDENLLALRNIEQQFLLELDGTRVASHANALNKRIHLTAAHGPFAVRDPFDDPDREAFLCFKKNSKLGVTSATYNLAVCYERGVGTEKDLRLAVQLYKKAADAGHGLAQFNLGALGVSGKVPGLTHEDGLALIRQAAKAGVEEAWTALLENIEEREVVRKQSVIDCHEDLTKGLEVLFRASQGKSLPQRRPRRSLSEPRNLELVDTGYASVDVKLSPVSPGHKIPFQHEAVPLSVLQPVVTDTGAVSASVNA